MKKIWDEQAQWDQQQDPTRNLDKPQDLRKNKDNHTTNTKIVLTTKIWKIKTYFDIPTKRRGKLGQYKKVQKELALLVKIEKEKFKAKI